MNYLSKEKNKILNGNFSISLEGCTTLITGASSGIGRSIAERFAQSGSDLILVDIDEKGMFETKDITTRYHVNAVLKIIDLTQKSQIESLWDDLGKGIPDILINNAGVYPFKNYLAIDEDFLKKSLDINMNSVFWMCQGFIKSNLNKGGIIVNLSSVEAILPFKEDLAHYSMGKAGVISLSRSLARDYGKKGFRVNTILPGAIRTPGTSNLAKMAISKLKLNLIKTAYDFQSRLSIGRWGNPDEVAKVVLFLCSDLASYVQGAIIPVDGGFLSS